MIPCKVSQISFSETYSVPPEQTTQRMFRLLPHGSGYADRMIDAMATGYLIAVLESICAREMQTYLDHDEELVVGSSVQCQHRAPIPAGALVKVDGWVVAVGEHEATFWVQASDEQETVCDGLIRFAIVLRSHMQTKMRRKCEAIQRRELFAMA